MTFSPASEYQVFPTKERPLKPYEAVVRAARETVPLVEELRAECVVADIITLAPALAGEMAGVPVATLVPHVDPRPGDGLPDLLDRGAAAADGARGAASGARPTASCGRAREGPRGSSTRRGSGSGCEPLPARAQRDLAAAVPARDAPPARVPARRPVPEHARRRPAAVGDPGRAGRRAAAGRRPGRAGRAVDVAGPRAPDAARRARGAGRRAGAGDRDVEPPRARPAAARCPTTRSSSTGSRTRRRCRRCDAVLCHAGHGTVVRALASGCAVVCCPAAGDMNENASRVDWAGLGTRLPRRLRDAPRRAARGAQGARVGADSRAGARGGGVVRGPRRRGGGGRPRRASWPPRAAPATTCACGSAASRRGCACRSSRRRPRSPRRPRASRPDRRAALKIEDGTLIARVAARPPLRRKDFAPTRRSLRRDFAFARRSGTV